MIVFRFVYSLNNSSINMASPPIYGSKIYFSARKPSLIIIQRIQLTIMDPQYKYWGRSLTRSIIVYWYDHCDPKDFPTHSYLCWLWCNPTRKHLQMEAANFQSKEQSNREIRWMQFYLIAYCILHSIRGGYLLYKKEFRLLMDCKD